MMKQFRWVGFILCVLIAVSGYAQTDKQKKLEQERSQILKELRQFDALLKTNQKQEKSELTLIEDLNYKISVRKNLIRITNEQANLLTRKINTNQKEITSLRAQLQELKDDYASMIQKSYKSKSEQSRVMFLLSSSNFKQAYKRLQYIRQYTNYQKEQGEAIKTKTKELQALNIKLSKQKETKKALVEENRIANRQLEKEKKESEQLMASIQATMGKLSLQIDKKKQEVKRIDREINRLIKVAIAASNKKAGKTTSSGKFVLTPEAKKLANSFAANKGKLGWPVSRGIIKGKFGKRRSLIDPTITNNYTSVQIATETNAKVKAVFKGEVSVIQVVKNGNLVVMIRHGDYLTIYSNLSKINVKKGDKVTTGQIIGEAFTNKFKGETLLGFRIYKNDKVLNPESWLTRL